MLGKFYAKWMYAWETSLTTRDTNRIVRPLEWGEDWLSEFLPALDSRAIGREGGSSTPLSARKDCGEQGSASGGNDNMEPGLASGRNDTIARDEGFERMVRLNQSIVARSD